MLLALTINAMLFIQHNHHHLAEITHIEPRMVCWNFQWDLLAPYILANALIFLAYFAIPIQFFLIARSRAGKWLTPEIIIYGLFILFCGIGHLLNVALVWFSIYPFAIAWDFLTGIISIAAAVQTQRIIRAVITLPDKGETADLKAAIDKELAKSSSPTRSVSLEEAVKLLEQSREFISRVQQAAP